MFKCLLVMEGRLLVCQGALVHSKGGPLYHKVFLPSVRAATWPSQLQMPCMSLICSFLMLHSAQWRGRFLLVLLLFFKSFIVCWSFIVFQSIIVFQSFIVYGLLLFFSLLLLLCILLFYISCVIKYISREFRHLFSPMLSKHFYCLVVGIYLARSFPNMLQKGL